jgi:hypothetical protein
VNRYILCFSVILLLSIPAICQDGPESITNNFGENHYKFAARIFASIEERWNLYAISSNHDLLFYDEVSLRREDSKVTLWTRDFLFDTSNPFPQEKELNDQLKKNDFGYFLKKYTIDCAKQTYILSYLAFYDRKGNRIGSEISNMNLKLEILPESTMETLQLEICKSKSDSK